jgi:hypothetical protein
MMSRSVSLLAVGVGILVTTHRVFAGGSIGWEDARARIGRDDPQLLAWVERTFDIRHVGVALRVGRQADGSASVEGAQVGDRLPPFEFPGKPKGSSGDYSLYLTFDYTERDKAAKPLWEVSVRRNVSRD